MSLPETLPEPELVIFDCDGVLVDSEPLSVDVLVRMLRAAGLDISADEAMERFLGRSLKTTTEIIRADYGLEVDDDMLETMRRDLYQRFQDELQAVAGVAVAVDKLKELGVATCVASSSQMERIRHSLEVTELLHRFEPHIFSATMVEHGKPAPDLFLHAARAMAVRPDACMVVEDSPAGVEAAKKAGMRVFAFTGASHARHDRHIEMLRALEPDGMFDDMRELIHFVRREQKVAHTG